MTDVFGIGLINTKLLVRFATPMIRTTESHTISQAEGFAQNGFQVSSIPTGVLPNVRGTEPRAAPLLLLFYKFHRSSPRTCSTAITTLTS